MSASRSFPLPVALLGALLVAACSGGPTTPPSGSAAPTGASTAAATGTASELPATSAPTPAPTLGAWQQATEQPSLADLEFGDVAWTGSRFVAIAHTEAGGTFVDSPDGGTWHRQPSGGEEWQPASIAAGGGRVAAVGTIGDAAAAWVSADGLTWSVHEGAFPTPSLGTDTLEVTDLVATDGGWLAVGRRDAACYFDCGLTSKQAFVWTSSDGVTWTQVPDQDSLKDAGMVAVTGTAGGFVAAGVANGHAAIWTSPDGQAWTRVPDDPMFGPPGGATIPEAPVDQEPPVSAVDVAARDGAIVVIGQSYGQDVCDPARADPICPGIRIWWSADGRSWSRATVDGARDGQAAALAATRDGFLAVGFATGCAGGVLSSVDGHGWACAATGTMFDGFAPASVAVSDNAEVVVGTTFFGDDDSSPPPRATVWYRTRG